MDKPLLWMEQRVKYLNIDDYIFIINSLYDEPQRSLHVQKVTGLLSDENPLLARMTLEQFLEPEEAHCIAMIDSQRPQVGLIGFFEAKDEASGARVLKQAQDYLREQGAQVLRGPVNLTIWHDYRFKTQGTPAIFDPANKDYYPKIWTDFGFNVAETFISGRRTEFSAVIKPTTPAYEAHKDHIREFVPEDLDRFREMSERIFKTSGSWNMVSLDPPSFAYLYKDILAQIQPRYTLVAEGDDGPEGFVFGIPNPLNPKELVLKTIGVLPEYHRSGVAAALLHLFHARAQEDGFASVYYALIRESNDIKKLPYEQYEISSRYECYEKEL